MAEHRIKISDGLYYRINEYAKLNSIPIRKLFDEIIEKGLSMVKWGTIPFGHIGEVKIGTEEESSPKSDYLETKFENITVSEPIPADEIKRIAERVCITSPGNTENEEDNTFSEPAIENIEEFKPRKRRL